MNKNISERTVALDRHTMDRKIAYLEGKLVILRICSKIIACVSKLLKFQLMKPAYESPEPIQSTGNRIKSKKILELELFADGKRYTSTDICKKLAESGIIEPKPYINHLLHRMVNDHLLHRVKRGVYEKVR